MYVDTKWSTTLLYSHPSSPGTQGKLVTRHLFHHDARCHRRLLLMWLFYLLSGFRKGMGRCMVQSLKCRFPLIWCKRRDIFRAAIDSVLVSRRDIKHLRKNMLIPDLHRAKWLSIISSIKVLCRRWVSKLHNNHIFVGCCVPVKPTSKSAFHSIGILVVPYILLIQTL